MAKRILAQICGLLLIMLLAGSCAAPAEVAEEMMKPATYYNDYLGLSITVPQGWQINALSDNLSLTQGQTALPRLIEYGEGSGRLELLDIQSTAENTSPEHSRFYAYAEIFPEPVAVEQYMDLLTSLLQSGDAARSYSLEKRDELPLARHTAQHIILKVDTSGQELTYTEEYYIVPLDTAFVVFYLNYWPQNQVSRASALSMLDNIVLPAP